MRYKRSLVYLALLSLATLGGWAKSGDPSEDSPTSQGGMIINRYVEAARSDASKPDAVEVDIDATVPRLNQHGRLRALRKISAVGKITYRVLGFQGDNSVKSQVIARYLQAEQESQNDRSLTLTPANYKFKLKAQKLVNRDETVFVFQVSPRAKRVGLFKGEVWLDSKSYLPVFEKGRLVKNPSVFFRRVDFERDFAILNGSAIPAHMNSVIDTRMVGKVNLKVAYISPVVTDIGAADEVSSPVIGPSSSLQ